MHRLNSRYIDSSILIFCTVIIGLLGLSAAVPLYDVYNSENEPAAIPMHYLKAPVQSNSQDYDNEVIEKVFKRNRNHIVPVNNPASSDSCCPTIVDIVEPSHGKNRSGDLVELYQSDNVRQLFYENSCAPSVANHPCRFLDRKHSPHSKCVQQYSYTYAMVRDVTREDADWKLDYIQIRSGCSCHITNT